MANCETCDKWFASERAAEQHMDAKNHWGYECETCELTFPSEEDADDHMDEEDHYGVECDTCDKDFNSQHAVVQHMIAVDHSQSDMSRDMVRLDSEHSIYQTVETIFDKKWYHGEKEASVRSIYFNRRFSYLFDKMPSGWRRLFHGTTRACHVGKSGDYLDLCSRGRCSLCSILRGGFKLPDSSDRSRPLMFGGGIYSTSVSSKADNYAWNDRIRSRLHGIILCLVFIGTYEKLHEADHWKTAPEEGCHSVMAATEDEGGAVVYTESVVYNPASILPIGLIMYTRKQV